MPSMTAPSEYVLYPDVMRSLARTAPDSRISDSVLVATRD
jgi:hypothetical protein